MKKVVLASMFYCASNETRPLHHHCPPGLSYVIMLVKQFNFFKCSHLAIKEILFKCNSPKSFSVKSWLLQNSYVCSLHAGRARAFELIVIAIRQADLS